MENTIVKTKTLKVTDIKDGTLQIMLASDIPGYFIDVTESEIDGQITLGISVVKETNNE